MAARSLSDAGFKVVLVERGRLPREKPCGGFISPQAAALIEEAFGPVPPGCMARPHAVRGARLLYESGGDYELPFPEPGLSVMRSRLDAHLAARSGAEVIDGCEVGSFEMESFHVSARIIRDEREETLEATYLVAADGAESTALRLLRPEFHRLYAAPRLERTMLVLSEGELDWDPQWIGLALMQRSTGIARFFIKDDLVGLAVNHDPARDWRDELEGLTTMLRNKAGLRLRGEAIRQVSASNRMAAGGHFNLGAGCALLVGEAAGLLDPWGFGIRLALESGRVAAESIAESAGERITPHIRYRYRMQEMLEREMKQRRDFGTGVGDLDTASLTTDRSRGARRDRRTLKRRFSK
jgi:flavin-dependent dehydrogenase